MGNEYLDTLTNWDDFKNTLSITQEELDEIDLKVRIVDETLAVVNIYDPTIGL